MLFQIVSFQTMNNLGNKNYKLILLSQMPKDKYYKLTDNKICSMDYTETILLMYIALFFSVLAMYTAKTLEKISNKDEKIGLHEMNKAPKKIQTSTDN